MPRTRSPACAALLLVASCGGCALFPDDAAPPLQPAPLAPADASDIVANARTRFAWAPVEGADRYDFHVFDRATGDIERYRVDDLRARDVCDAERCSIEMSLSLPRMKDHAWRVRARNLAGASGWSRAVFAMVDVDGGDGSAGAPSALPAGSRAPRVPVVLAPVGATLRADEVATFEWRASVGALGYDFHLFDATSRELVDDVRGLAPEDVCDASGQCSLALAPALPPAANHAWRVRATNGYGASEWTRTVLAVVPRDR